jgi:hypothetical protein
MNSEHALNLLDAADVRAALREMVEHGEVALGILSAAKQRADRNPLTRGAADEANRHAKLALVSLEQITHQLRLMPDTGAQL